MSKRCLVLLAAMACLTLTISCAMDNSTEQIAVIEPTATAAPAPASESSPAPAAADTPSASAAADQEDINMNNPNHREVAVLDTDAGVIVLGFFPDVAPKHVENFVQLARSGFYNGTKFHRIIPGFMIQGGDPNTKTADVSSWGMGGPGSTVPAEFNNKPHIRGTLSMARSSDPNSAGSQFFICQVPYPSLDGKYTVFGETLEGLEVVDKIVTAPIVPETKNRGDRPINPVAIKNVVITTWGEYQQTKSQ
ncbi:MAG: peptidylprolyl isomerase [Candidatus Omnitrophota bacterium]